MKMEDLFIRLCRLRLQDLNREYLCDNRYLYGGRVEADDEYGAAYLQRQAQRLKTAGLGMLKSADKKADGEMLLQSSEILLRGI